MVTLKNERIVLTVAEKGAEMQSVLVDGEERLWQGDPAVWSGRAPVLFPFCGALPPEGYIAEGNTYRIEKKHGFARQSTFTVERQAADTVTLLLTDSEETRAVYPYAFAFRVTYALAGNVVTVTYAAENTGDRPLYCSVGSHEAYATPEGVEEYEVAFACEETAPRLLIAENGLFTGEARPFFERCRVYRPRPADFLDDAVVTHGLRSQKLTFRRRDGARSVTVAFSDCPYLLFWQKPGAPFFCIEPWSGIGQRVSGEREIARLDGILRVDAGDTLIRSHTLTFD